jgi:hypothetical protein
MMCIGSDFAVVCEESIQDPGQRAAVRARLEQGGHEIVPIDFDQMRRFAGNMLELSAADGSRVLALSARALESLRPDQVHRLESRCTLVPVPVATIEDSAGGGVRCMLAEVHLPPRG